MLETWPVSLTERGGRLGGQLLLALLERFEGRQIATLGMTAIPLLESVILQSGGRYTGLVIRKERKAHGSSKLIEGPADKREPVVLLDDSISSGTSMFEAKKRLEEAGFIVEGGVALVRFGWKGGTSLMQQLGARIETVYDIWDDFMTQMPDERTPARNPSRPFHELPEAPTACPEGLSACELSRFVVEHVSRTGEVPAAPKKMSDDVDTAGGAWLSVRSRDNIHLRHAREGFWRFPWDAPSPGAADDVVLAASKVGAKLRAAGNADTVLKSSGFALTTFGALEPCEPGDLDNDRYGIVVRSAERTWKMGGALPRMPGIATSWQQLQHARMKNAGLEKHEPFDVFRHDVHKLTESDITWQPTGVPRPPPSGVQLESVARPVLERALSLVREQMGEPPKGLPAVVGDDAVGSVHSVYLTLYVDGRLAGCMGAKLGDLDNVLTSLAKAVLADVRFSRPEKAKRIAVSVSFLRNRLILGNFSVEEVAQRVRRGEQALMAYQGEKLGLLLPFVAAAADKDTVGFAREVLKKAAIHEPPFGWVRYDCDTWLLDDSGRMHKLQGAFPARRPRARPQAPLVQTARRVGRYLVRQQRGDGKSYPFYNPLRNALLDGTDAPRLAHGAWTLACAASVLEDTALAKAARRGLDWLESHRQDDLDGEIWLSPLGTPATVAEVTFALLSHAEMSGAAHKKAVREYAAALALRVDANGRVRTHFDPAQSHDAFQDYFPAQVALALGRATELGAFDDAPLAERLLRALRMRWRGRKSLGMVSWLPQALEVWLRLRDDARDAEVAYAVADEILRFQHDDTGAFENEHQPDTPGFTTALYIEGVAAAARIAAARGDKARAKRYAAACRRGCAFVERLVLGADDEPVLPDPTRADGAVLPSPHAATVRVDYASHALAALLGTLSLD
jgi:orotate phosphoribosyltransferase/AMMECR1 domain-containing protein